MRLNIIFVTIFLGLYYLFAPLVVMFFVKDEKKYKLIRAILLSSFFILLFVGVLCKIDFNKKSLYIGFDFTSVWAGKPFLWKFPKFKIDIVINSLMLIPIGQWVFLNNIRKKKAFCVWKALIWGILMGGIIEILQFILPVNRSVQFSDIVLNTLSTVIGYVYMFVIFWVKNILIKFAFKRQ